MVVIYSSLMGISAKADKKKYHLMIFKDLSMIYDMYDDMHHRKVLIFSVETKSVQMLFIYTYY